MGVQVKGLPGALVEGCVFCAISVGRAPAEIVCQETGALAFLDIHPVAPGHTLVIPRRHADSIAELDEEAAAAVMRLATRMARALYRALQPDGLTLLQNDGRAAGQEVPHFHLHLIPRWYGDGLRMGRGLLRRPAESPAEIGRRIRAALGG